MTGELSSIGSVVLSIDMPAEHKSVERGDHRLANELFHMVESRRLPASWVPAPTQHFPLNDALAAANSRHDLALAGDSSWIGKTAGRTRFARELAARVEAVRANGINVAAIALGDAQLDDHLDLLVKHRIGVIRDQRRTAMVQPQAIRFGVWHCPVSLVLPQQKEWSLFGTNWSLRQTVRRAIRTGTVAHIAIDGSRLTNQPALTELDLVLAHLQRQRDKGHLVVMSLGGLAASLVRKPAAKKASSILRAA